MPLYFWFGGIAAGSSFVALACDLAGDERSAAVARKVALGALGPSPVLLILDLGRPERFVNMLRIFKPRSPMSMGAWALTLFGNLAAGAVGADLLGRRATRAAARRGQRDRRRLPRLLHRRAAGLHRGAGVGALAAVPRPDLRLHRRRHRRRRLPAGARRRRAAGRAPDAARARHGRDRPRWRPSWGSRSSTRSGSASSPRGSRTGRPGTLFKAAKWSVRVGLSLRFARSRGGPWVHHVASVLYLAAGLAFRYAWVGAGRHSARHDEVVAKMARETAAARSHERAARLRAAGRGDARRARPAGREARAPDAGAVADRAHPDRLLRDRVPGDVPVRRGAATCAPATRPTRRWPSAGRRWR